MYAAKAVYAMVMAALTAALSIWVDNPYLTLATAALVPLGVYLVPNTPATADPRERTHGPDPFV